MDTFQINYLCKSDMFIKKYFLGCMACDQLPKRFPDNSLAIVNLDPIAKTGIHWIVCSSLNSKFSLYIDSFGRDISNSYILSSLANRGKPIWYNNEPLQHKLTSVCSQYCIFFLYLLSRKFSLTEILKKFFSNIDNPLKNDAFVRDFISVVFSMESTPPLLDINHIKKIL